MDERVERDATTATAQAATWGPQHHWIYSIYILLNDCPTASNTRPLCLPITRQLSLVVEIQMYIV